jgi:ankyrin repeat protein
MIISRPISPTTQRFFDAIRDADVTTLRSMVAEGFDIGAAELEYGQGAVEEAVEAHFDGDPRPVIKALLELGADINAYVDETNALLKAVWHCDVELVEWLILHGADINFVHREGMTRQTALDFAFADQQISESDPNCGYPSPAEYKRLIDMMQHHGARTADELGAASS